MVLRCAIVVDTKTGQMVIKIPAFVRDTLFKGIQGNMVEVEIGRDKKGAFYKIYSV